MLHYSPKTLHMNSYQRGLQNRVFTVTVVAEVKNTNCWTLLKWRFYYARKNYQYHIRLAAPVPLSCPYHNLPSPITTRSMYVKNHVKKYDLWIMCVLHICFTCFSLLFTWISHSYFTRVKNCIVKHVWKGCEVYQPFHTHFHPHFTCCFTCKFTLICYKISHGSSHKFHMQILSEYMYM